PTQLTVTPVGASCAASERAKPSSPLCAAADAGKTTPPREKRWATKELTATTRPEVDFASHGKAASARRKKPPRMAASDRSKPSSSSAPTRRRAAAAALA